MSVDASSAMSQSADLPDVAKPARHLLGWVMVLGTMIVMTALVIAAGVIRSAHISAFTAGQHYLSTPVGATELLCLACGSLAMVCAGWCVRLGWRQVAMLLLLTTFGCGASFLGLKAAEYQVHVAAGLEAAQFTHPKEPFLAAWHSTAPKAQHAAAPVKPPIKQAALPKPADPVHGRTLFLGTCASCHGPTGAGMPKQGADLRDSEFIAGMTDAKLLSFVKVGRQPWDPQSKLKLTMPGRGGNPSLNDDKLRDIIAYVRQLQLDAKQTKAALASAPSKPADTTPGTELSPPIAAMDDMPLPPLGTFLPGPGIAAQGLSQQVLYRLDHPANRFDASLPPGMTPARLRVFFMVFLTLVASHCMFVFVGMAVVTLQFVRLWRTENGTQMIQAVEISSYYWHLLGVAWLVLFPLLYLMR